MKTTTAILALATTAGVAAVSSAALAADPRSEEEQVQENMNRFDRLDFDAYSHRKDMKRFRDIHCPAVKVVFPDGRTTHGIDGHVKDIDGLFNGTPDSRITAHPIAFGSGDWTATTGVLEATFSEPKTLADGKSIPPTGKKVKIPMATIARWKNGCIAEERLFWDSAEYMKQLGLGK